MALPQPNIEWPPKPFDTAFDLMVEHDAWYRGDINGLEKVYGSRGRSGQPRVRPSQQRGGLVGAVSRFFWGRPVPQGQSRSKIHVPVPADIATAAADLLFSDPPKIYIPNSVKRANGLVTVTPEQQRLERIFNDPITQAELLEGAELSSALSGVYLRLVWDTSVADHVIIDAVAADQAIPEWQFGRLRAVTFWTVVHRDGDRVWRHLERHEVGRIFHGLYEGTTNKLGRMIPLAERPETEWATNLVDADGGIDTGVDELTAGYVPNIRPQRNWRDIPQLAPFGRSDFDGVEPLFDAIDEVYSSWLRDIRLAKARLLVPEAYLSDRGPGKGATFDPDQEIYAPLNFLGKGADQAPITPQQFEIRYQEHQETIRDLTRTALRAAGYSAATLGDDGLVVGAKTATEVKADERLSDRTRDKKIRYWKAALGPLARTAVNLDMVVFPGQGSPLSEIPVADFPEKAQQDPEELARTSQLLRNAEAASTETLVAMNHPDWDKDQVSEEVQKIMAQRSAAPDPFDFRPGIDE